MRVAAGESCLTSACHSDLHKTEYIHAPVALNTCDACHGPEQEGHKFPMKRAGDATCSLCHMPLTGKKFIHAAIPQNGCTRCHNPHGSNTKFSLVAATSAALCRQCHPDSQTGSHLHQPFATGACSTCHTPHESDNAHFTIQSGPAHCYRCHADIQRIVTTAVSPHGPATQNCLTCHEAHRAEHPKLLKAEAGAQCRSCHANVDEQIRTATSRHGAVFVGKQCANCHDPHGGSQPRVLKAPVVDLCLSCHDKEQKAYDGRTIPEMKTKLTTSKFLHGPVREGDCQACHQVHGSSNSRLLAKYFPGDFYKDFDLSNYALCFSCHEKALVMDQETTTLTDFRNGSRNLHFVHVNRMEKGRSCKTCHEIHGSDQPKHIATSVPFEGGNWAMPIKFAKTATGGSCGPGCHKPYEYDRETPVKYSNEGAGP